MNRTRFRLIRMQGKEFKTRYRRNLIQSS